MRSGPEFAAGGDAPGFKPIRPALPGAGGYRQHAILAVSGDGAENITGFPYGPEHNIAAARGAGPVPDHRSVAAAGLISAGAATFVRHRAFT